MTLTFPDPHPRATPVSGTPALGGPAPTGQLAAVTFEDPPVIPTSPVYDDFYVQGGDVLIHRSCLKGRRFGADLSDGARRTLIALHRCGPPGTDWESATIVTGFTDIDAAAPGGSPGPGLAHACLLRSVTEMVAAEPVDTYTLSAVATAAAALVEIVDSQVQAAEIATGVREPGPVSPAVIAALYARRLAGRLLPGEPVYVSVAELSDRPPDMPAAELLESHGLLAVCQDDDCPSCGWPETFAIVNPGAPSIGAWAVGCRKCGWWEPILPVSPEGERAVGVSWPGFEQCVEHCAADAASGRLAATLGPRELGLVLYPAPGVAPDDARALVSCSTCSVTATAELGLERVHQAFEEAVGGHRARTETGFDAGEARVGCPGSGVLHRGRVARDGTGRCPACNVSQEILAAPDGGPGGVIADHDAVEARLQPLPSPTTDRRGA